MATSGPGAIHLLTGLYDAKADSTPVIAVTGNTYSDMMGSKYQQDVDLVGREQSVHDRLPSVRQRCSHIRNAESNCSVLTGFAR